MFEKNTKKSYYAAVIYHSDSPKKTQKVASDLAATYYGGGPAQSLSADRHSEKRRALSGARIIALEGELGAGKTTFVQAFARALGVRAKVKSPTFNLIKKYKIPKRHKDLYHIDCYRLKDHKEAVRLGIQDIFNEQEAWVLIEWPERIEKILPKKITKVHIDHTGKDKRKITITK